MSATRTPALTPPTVSAPAGTPHVTPGATAGSPGTAPVVAPSASLTTTAQTRLQELTGRTTAPVIPGVLGATPPVPAVAVHEVVQETSLVERQVADLRTKIDGLLALRASLRAAGNSMQARRQILIDNQFERFSNRDRFLMAQLSGHYAGVLSTEIFLDLPSAEDKFRAYQSVLKLGSDARINIHINPPLEATEEELREYQNLLATHSEVSLPRYFPRDERTIPNLRVAVEQVLQWSNLLEQATQLTDLTDFEAHMKKIEDVALTPSQAEDLVDAIEAFIAIRLNGRIVQHYTGITPLVKYYLNNDGITAFLQELGAVCSELRQAIANSDSHTLKLSEDQVLGIARILETQIPQEGAPVAPGSQNGHFSWSEWKKQTNDVRSQFQAARAALAAQETTPESGVEEQGYALIQKVSDWMQEERGERSFEEVLQAWADITHDSKTGVAEILTAGGDRYVKVVQSWFDGRTMFDQSTWWQLQGAARAWLSSRRS